MHFTREPLTFGDSGFEADGLGVQMCRNVVHYTCWAPFQPRHRLGMSNGDNRFGKMAMGGQFGGLLHVLGNQRAGSDVVVSKTALVELL
jgi:hypothetical protein